MDLPPNAPYWLVALALLVGWIASNVWPAVRGVFVERLEVGTDLQRARAEAELARVERQIAAEEAKAAAEERIADVLTKLAELVQINIEETRENKKALASLTTAFSMQISQMPTLRDIQHIAERLSAIEVHLAHEFPDRLSRRTTE